MKKRKNLIYKIFSWQTVVILSLILQLAFIGYFIFSGANSSRFIAIALETISFIIIIYILLNKEKGVYKIPWIYLNLFMPIFGSVLFLMLKSQSSTKKLSKGIIDTENNMKGHSYFMGEAIEECVQKLPNHANKITYLEKSQGFPIYKNSKAKYYPSGEEMLKGLKQSLIKAKKYIFMEYFIIEDGKMWQEIFSILKLKASRGVEVRVIYDDIGCMGKLPQNFKQTLQKHKIQCAVFNPFRPFLTSIQNNRDHRKITIIDGTVAFTGGINIADEYINEVERFGHWKDTAVKITGKGAWGFTTIFLQMWELITKKKENFAKYFPQENKEKEIIADGYVQPYADSPMNNEDVAEEVYLSVIQNAKRYLYITTPYLILDDTMLKALSLSAKSGVDVKILTPYIPDKKFVHMTTKSYYHDLILSGVKIYEYEKGFIHSKMFVSDDEVAVVGTANLDYRSLYLHFECGVVMYKSREILEIKKDVLQTLNESKPITQKDCKANIFKRITQSFLRMFAPLM